MSNQENMNDIASAFEILSDSNSRRDLAGNSAGLSKRMSQRTQIFDPTLEKMGEEEDEEPAKNWWTRFLRFVEVKQHHSASNRRSEGIVESFLYNDDLAPVDAARRVWGWKQYVFFWISGSFNVNTWQISATGLQLGLSWWQTWICIWIGYVSVALFVVVGSRIGNFYHISFPISSRISFGVYFSLWVVLNRVVMACVWYSVQTYIGSQTVQLMLMSIFGTDLTTRIKNTMNTPNINTFQFMCFMLFWGAQLPALWFPPQTLRYLFTFKSIVTPFAAFGFLIWTLKKAHGNLALGSLNELKPTGAVLGWNFVISIMSALDNFSTLILNAPDFSRFAKTEKSSIYSQLFILPIMYAIISIIGILVTSAAYTMYGVNYWSPLDVLAQFLNHFTSGNRAGVFLISFAFGIAQLGTNIASNSISAGTDMTALLPKFINIRRGSYICAAISLAICPWNLMSSSSKFTTALAAYAVFLSSIAGVVASDYYVVRKGLIRLQHCFTNKPNTLYMYGSRFGTNWRAVAAYVIGIVPNFPGFIGSVGPKVPENAMRVYYLNYFVGFLVSFLVYAVLCYFWRVPGMPEGVGFFDFSTWFEKWTEVEDFAEQRRKFELHGAEVDFDEESSTSYVSITEPGKV
ncbi:LAMI_0A02894g1_1 [Lachancea mirantina]|uniref:LAMI_0A02894g1_1 n=1 Tax=Lachancea mirantina TaxID=1230905 RepID=A0A1G4IND0_9SACH|nr:LAMI_0A02894g1_1 [Lachancea mirantina]